MPQFDAETIVDPIKLKLDPYVPGFGWTVIPEPSDRQVGTFLAGLKRVLTEANDKLGDAKQADVVDVTDRQQVMAALEALDPDDFVHTADAMAQLHADLCAGPPGSVPVVTKDQLLAVPLRKRNLLYNWLQEEVLNPEAGAPAGNAAANHQLLPAGA